MDKEKSGSNLHVIVWTAAITAVVVLGAVWLYGWLVNQNSTLTNTPVTNSTASTSTTATATPAASGTTITYTSSKNGFSFQYPKSWTVDNPATEVDYGSAFSVSLTDPSAGLERTIVISVFNSVGDLPIINGSGTTGKANATSLTNYFVSQKVDYKAVTSGANSGYDVRHPDIGGYSYYYFLHSGKVYVVEFPSSKSASIQSVSTLAFTN